MIDNQKPNPRLNYQATVVTGVSHITNLPTAPSSANCWNLSLILNLFVTVFNLIQTAQNIQKKAPEIVANEREIAPIAQEFLIRMSGTLIRDVGPIVNDASVFYIQYYEFLFFHIYTHLYTLVQWIFHNHWFHLKIHRYHQKFHGNH